MENASQNDSKLSAPDPSFGRFFGYLRQTLILSRSLITLWLPFGAILAPFCFTLGSRWFPFGSILVTFGSLLAFLGHCCSPWRSIFKFSGSLGLSFHILQVFTESHIQNHILSRMMCIENRIVFTSASTNHPKTISGGLTIAANIFTNS